MRRRFLDVEKMDVKTRDRMLPHRVHVREPQQWNTGNIHEWLRSDEFKGEWAVENLTREDFGICVATGQRRSWPVHDGQTFFFSDPNDAFNFRLRFG